MIYTILGALLCFILVGFICYRIGHVFGYSKAIDHCYQVHRRWLELSKLDGEFGSETQRTRAAFMRGDRQRF